MKQLIYIFVFTAIAICQPSSVKAQSASSDAFRSNLEKLIMSENQPGKLFSFQEEISDSVLEYRMAYLGNLNNKQYHTLKLIYIETYTGVYQDSKKCKSVISVYHKDKSLGQYYIGGKYDSIPVIENNELVIKQTDNSCHLTTRISFLKSIPDTIFIECSEADGRKSGDLYNFEKNTEL